MHMEALSDWTENARKLEQQTIDWKAVAAGTAELRVRQLPGPYNSMGRIKFEFPNDMGIYLHDTPERELLAKDDRHFSNGCIRLEDANGLGRWLLGKPVRTGGPPEQVVQLPLPVPVYLTYFTVYEGPNGAVQFTPDLYQPDLPPGARPALPPQTVAVSPSKHPSP
jgi:L,D-transpeptidase YcbB